MLQASFGSQIHPGKFGMSRFQRSCSSFLESRFALSLHSAMEENRWEPHLWCSLCRLDLLSWPPVCFFSCDLLQSACQLHLVSQPWQALQDMQHRQHKQRRSLLWAAEKTPGTAETFSPRSSRVPEGLKAHQEQLPSCSPALSTTWSCLSCLQEALWPGHSLLVAGTLSMCGSGLLLLPRIAAHSGNSPQPLLPSTALPT